VRVAICEYGAGNVRSVALAFERVGARIVDDAATADLAVLPGVGSAAAARAGLSARGLDNVLRARVADGKPVLGICLGLQLALDETEEDGGVEGLGIVPGRAVRLREGRVPRIGWAEVEPLGEAFYFAHSYAAETSAAVATSPACSSTPRRAAPPARASWRRSASPASDPVPRRRGRPRCERRQLRGLA
jgi:imidazole glycerol phosphate synthase glutamine amidotransferase subunit